MIFGPASPKVAACVALRGRLAFLCFLFLALTLHAENLAFSNLMAQGQTCDEKRDTRAALEFFLKAEQLSPTNGELLFFLAKQYCDMMHLTNSQAQKKQYAAQSLDYSRRAAAADPLNPKFHLCAAVCYAKNFPFLDNQTRINFSRQIKIEAEKAIALDPKYDLPYHMLGRWNCEVANMNLLLKGIVRVVYGGLPGASNDQAIENFKKAIELAPGRVIHHLQLAHVYHLTGKDKLALAELNACQGLTPLDLDDSDAQRIAHKISETGRWPSVF